MGASTDQALRILREVIEHMDCLIAEGDRLGKLYVLSSDVRW